MVDKTAEQEVSSYPPLGMPACTHMKYVPPHKSAQQSWKNLLQKLLLLLLLL